MTASAAIGRLRLLLRLNPNAGAASTERAVEIAATLTAIGEVISFAPRRDRYAAELSVSLGSRLPLRVPRPGAIGMSG